MRTIKRLNEEIARWAFETVFKKNSAWRIAFTNPTAGPWKTIKADSLLNGNEGEVYRFILEEDRPDIIMYNDALKAVIIFEAKDSLEKLLVEKQATKSADVVIKLAQLLQGKYDNEYWRGRQSYKIILGLLWGSTDDAVGESEKNRLYDFYHSLIEHDDYVYHDLIIGVETLYTNDKLKCYGFSKSYGSTGLSYGEEIIKSFAL